jgi:Spy/CpxP family protein refolding chaperone
MNKMLIAVALSLAIPAGVAAGMGNPGPGGPHRGPNLERMTQTLGLSQEQRAQLESVIQAQQEKRQALREETRTSIRAILTPEQQAQMDEMRQTRRARWDGHRHCQPRQRRHAW